MITIELKIKNFYIQLRKLWDELDEERLCNFLKSSHPLSKEFFNTWETTESVIKGYMKGEVEEAKVDFWLEKLKQVVLKINNFLKFEQGWEEI